MQAWLPGCLGETGTLGLAFLSFCFVSAPRRPHNLTTSVLLQGCSLDVSDG